MNIKKLISIFLIYINLLSNVSASIFISEIMPNTIDDVNLEYIQLTNSGELLESLSGYILKDKSEKQFIFGSGFFLESFESKKFFRPEIKILLNNSNEEIYLYDNSGILIDSVFYDKTEKGVAIIIKNITNSGELEDGTGIIETNSGELENGTGIIETNSGELENGTGIIETNSGELEDGTGIIETNSGELEDGTGIIDTNSGELEDELIKFSIIYNFQNPTYLLEKDKIIDNYTCDNSKKECKINLDFRDTFTGGLNEKDYECFLDFGLGTGILNGEENKCNPSSFIIPEGKFYFKFLIQNKTNTGIFSTGSISINNNGYLENTQIIKKNSPSASSNSTVYIRRIPFDQPEIIIQSGLGENNLCKNNDCKLNLKYLPESSDFVCEWDFDGGTFDTLNTDKKCNPGFVSYALGDYKIKLRVYQKNLTSNFKDTFLEFSNKEIIPIFDINNNTGKLELFSGKLIDELSGALLYEFDGEETKNEYLNQIEKSFSIGYRKLKSGLKIYGNTIPNADIFLNLKENQNISLINLFVSKANADYIYNIKSDINGDFELLLNEINAGNIEISSKIVDNLGNEINITKSKKITLEADYISEMKQYVYNKVLKEINKYSDEIEISSPQASLLDERELENIIAIINLQGKIGTNKELVGNTLYCYDTCSVNFDGSKSSGNIEKYLWDFGNGVTFEGKNPGYIKYEKFGNYNVTLTLVGKNEEKISTDFLVVFTKIQKKVNTKDDSIKNDNLIINVSDAGNSEYLDEENQNNNGILIYLIIICFSIFLLFLILRKEKLI